MRPALRRAARAFPVLALLASTFTGCSWVHVRSIKALDPHGAATFEGVSALLHEAGTSRVDILVVHGFGTHVSGYSDPLQARLTGDLALTGPRCGGDLPMQGGEYGSLRVCEYSARDGRRLRV